MYQNFDTCIINDIDTNLINFYEQVRTYPIDLLIEQFLRWRDDVEFDQLKEFREKLHQPIEEPLRHAFMYYTMVYCGFGGKVYDTGTRSNFDRYKVKDIRHHLHSIRDVLNRCEINNKDYREILHKNCLYYFDPPYAVVGSPSYYGYHGENHSNFDHNEFKEFVDKIAKDNLILISYEDSEFIRELFKEYTIVTVPKKTVCCSSSDGVFSKQTDEVLIFNYAPRCQSAEEISLF